MAAASEHPFSLKFFGTNDSSPSDGSSKDADGVVGKDFVALQLKLGLLLQLKSLFTYKSGLAATKPAGVCFDSVPFSEHTLVTGASPQHCAGALCTADIKGGGGGIGLCRSFGSFIFLFS